MKKIITRILLTFLVFNLSIASSFANTEPKRGDVTWKSAGAGALSLLIWPGIGQSINDNKKDKVLTHALIGLCPIYRFWSGYDALFARKGGYWKGRI